MRKVLGVFVIVVIAFLVLARISYQINDVELFKSPPTQPAENWCGMVGASIVHTFLLYFGEAFWILPFCLILFFHKILHDEKPDYLMVLAGTMLLLPVVSVAITMFTEATPDWAPSYGGLFAYKFGTAARTTIGPVGTWIILLIGFIGSLALWNALGFYKFLKRDRTQDVSTEASGTEEPGVTSTIKEKLGVSKFIPKPKLEAEEELEPVEREMPQVSSFTPTVPDSPEPIHQEKANRKPRETKKSNIKTHVIRKAEDGDVVLPSLSLLDHPISGSVDSEEFLQQRGKQLEEMFNNFKIGCRVIGMERGPSITQFELVIDEGIRVNKVTGLSDNIALTLRAPSVRVVAPIPGRNTIGIEIPNLKKELVNLRSIMETSECKVLVESMKLPLVLGKDVAGAPLISCLSKMPHLLVAGTTGSGKSVCINSIIISLIFYNKPSEVKLIMIDPKMVEMSGYQDIPHLMTPVITDMNLAAGALEWACKRMDERYRTLTQFRVRDIATFNKLPKGKVLENLEEGQELEDIEWPMPYIVIIVDEFSDLMMVGAKEIEAYITRLAQKSRAVGIHVILATQRPSVDVITGLIKTNMPSRIAFQVAARIDSRTILDQNGADKLLGKGDMLFMPPGTAALVRSQGVMVTDDEIHNLVEYWKEQAPPHYIDMKAISLKNRKGKGGGPAPMDEDEDNGDDEYFQRAVQAVLENNRPSASFIQRQLKVGYNKASRLIEMMEERGIVSPSKGSKGREVYMTWEEFSGVPSEMDNSGAVDEEAAEEPTEPVT